MTNSTSTAQKAQASLLDSRGMNGSIVSYPERGPWGDPKWRGNAPGGLYLDLFAQLRPNYFIDAMSGSGTAIDAARDAGIPKYLGLDLHNGFDCLTMSILERAGEHADLVCSHPPYHNMVRYSGHVHGTHEHPNDLSHCESVEDFLQKLQAVVLNQREATKTGGYYATIIGDHRVGGQYHSYQAGLQARLPSNELAGIIIKAQHNTMSCRRQYGRMAMPRILHEYVLIWQRKGNIRSMVNALSVIAKEQAQALRGTWRAIVRLALIELGGKATLSELYAKVAEGAADRVAQSQHFEAKVRQVLQLSKEFKPVERGVWSLAS